MNFFSKYKSNGLWWFRIFGYGVVGKNIKKHKLLFSERNGYTKFVRVGNWIFKFIKPQVMRDKKYEKIDRIIFPIAITSLVLMFIDLLTMAFFLLSYVRKWAVFNFTALTITVAIFAVASIICITCFIVHSVTLSKMNKNG